MGEIVGVGRGLDPLFPGRSESGEVPKGTVRRSKAQPNPARCRVHSDAEALALATGPSGYAFRKPGFAGHHNKLESHSHIKQDRCLTASSCSRFVTSYHLNSHRRVSETGGYRDERTVVPRNATTPSPGLALKNRAEAPLGGGGRPPTEQRRVRRAGRLPCPHRWASRSAACRLRVGPCARRRR